MSPQVDLYNNSYSNYETDVYRQIRLATYGEDLGQTSWVTNEESREIPQMLDLAPGSCVLEIGCGSGRYAVQIAETAGCRVVGVDINADGLRNGNALAHARNLSDRARFEDCDASQGLPYPDASFDATFANDVCAMFPDGSDTLSATYSVIERKRPYL